jgi:non-ribosomal peptide synthetase component F
VTSDSSARCRCFHPSGSFVEFKKEAIEQSIPERFEKIAHEYPARLAVKTKHQALTYDELNRASNRIA